MLTNLFQYSYIHLQAFSFLGSYPCFLLLTFITMFHKMRKPTLAVHLAVYLALTLAAAVPASLRTLLDRHSRTILWQCHSFNGTGVPCGQGLCQCYHHLADCSGHFRKGPNITSVPVLPPGVEVLCLGYDAITYVPRDFFLNSRDVLKLDLSGNGLTALQPESFSLLTVGLSLGSLLMLRLHGMQLNCNQLATNSWKPAETGGDWLSPGCGPSLPVSETNGFSRFLVACLFTRLILFSLQTDNFFRALQLNCEKTVAAGCHSLLLVSAGFQQEIDDASGTRVTDFSVWLGRRSQRGFPCVLVARKSPPVASGGDRPVASRIWIWLQVSCIPCKRSISVERVLGTC